jgi:hypothetical protein
MAQRTKIVLVFVFLLAGLFVAAQVQAAETPASTAPVASIPPAADQPDWFHNPAPWLEQGGDFRFRTHYGYNWTSFTGEAKTKDGYDSTRWRWERYRTRLWDKFKLDEDTSINTRFTWEFRQWDDPASKPQRTDLDEIIMDTFNLTKKNFLGLPATAVIGRQDIQNLGQGWLVFDGTPVDGSRTMYFDAIRVTWDLAEKTKLDTIYVRNMPKSDWLIKPINDRNNFVNFEEEQGAILYLTDKSHGDMQIEGYFMYKNNNPVNYTARNLPTTAALHAFSKKAEIYTFGGALSGPLNNNWSYRVEGAVQTGRSASPCAGVTPYNQTEQLLAFGEKSTLEYSFKDDLDNKVHVTYEYLSGDNPNTKKVEGFNPLWGQWPQWSEFLQGPYVNSMEDRLSSNLHRLDFGHKIKPNQQWEILTDWNLLWADENTYKSVPAKFSENGKFRGNLFTCWARYKFSKNLSGNLIGEYMMPGNYYAGSNEHDALYFHWTVVYTF